MAPAVGLRFLGRGLELVPETGAVVFALLILASCQTTAPPTPKPEEATTPANDRWQNLPEEFRPFEVKAPRGSQRASFELRRVLRESAPGSFEVPTADGSSLRVAPEVILSERDVIQVEVGPPIPPTIPHFTVYLHFNANAAQRLHDASDRLLGEQLAFVLEGRVLIAPLVNSRIDSPVMIADSFTREQAIELAERLAPQ